MGASARAQVHAHTRTCTEINNMCVQTSACTNDEFLDLSGRRERVHVDVQAHAGACVFELACVSQDMCR